MYQPIHSLLIIIVSQPLPKGIMISTPNITEEKDPRIIWRHKLVLKNYLNLALPHGPS
jgi:hypothetical protein